MDISAQESRIKYSCDKCENKVYSQPGDLRLHNQVVHQGITYACDLCEKVFTRKQTLTRHKAIQHQRIEKKHKCDLCVAAFHTSSHLKGHVASVHHGIKTNLKLQCSKCEKVYATKPSFYHHSSHLKKITVRYINCMLCTVLIFLRTYVYHSQARYKTFYLKSYIC